MSREKIPSRSSARAAVQREPSRGDLPRKIEELRRGFSLDQRGLAAVLGVSHASISDWERGKYEPSAELLNRLAALAYREDAIYFYRMAGVDFRWAGAPDAKGTAPPRHTEVSVATAARILNVGEEQVIKLFEKDRLAGRRVSPQGAPVIDYESLLQVALEMR